jgi:hypothetical protein
MSILLYVLGVLATLAGLVAIGFGTPASALDFGNTLIAAGATAAVGGLIIIAVGAAVSRLQRIADLLSAPLHAEYPAPPPPPPPPPKPPRTQARPGWSEAKASSEPAPAPFEPRGPSTPPEFPPFSSVPTSVHETAPEAKPDTAASQEPEPAPPEPAPDVHQAEPPPPEAEAPPREPELPPKSFFDAVWPEEKALEPQPPEAPAPEPPPPEPAPPEPLPPAAERQRAAILKSGVVDGMGYTLYVDGSIEAELPQGTMRFASIHELRAHLEKNEG